MREVAAPGSDADAARWRSTSTCTGSPAAIAAMPRPLGGLDALVFTGGVGERAPAVRSGAAARLRYLGVEVDGGRDATATMADPSDPDAEISADGAAVRTLVVRAREDLQIAAGVEQALTPGRAGHDRDRGPHRSGAHSAR